MQPFVEKYRPKKLSDIIGQDQQVNRALRFVNNYNNEKKKALLLHGIGGVGKTSLAIAIANECNLELVEYNASDVRNKQVITDKLNASIKQKSLFSQGKLILFDEIDGLSGTQDRGGVQALIQIIKKSKYPILLTANDAFSKKLSGLRRYCELVELKPLKHQDIKQKLISICHLENIPYEEQAISMLSRSCGGDLRGAITDLQTMQETGVTKKTIQQLGVRRQKDSIPKALVRILKSKQASIARETADLVDEDIDTLFLWIEENVALEYKQPDDLKKAFDMLSAADVFRGRIIRWQHYRFLVYVIDLMTAGVAIAKKDRYKEFIQYKQPSRLLTYWKAKQTYARREDIISRLVEEIHTSKKQAKKDFFLLSNIICSDKQLIEELELSSEDINYLKRLKSKPRTT